MKHKLRFDSRKGKGACMYCIPSFLPSFLPDVCFGWAISMSRETGSSIEYVYPWSIPTAPPCSRSFAISGQTDLPTYLAFWPPLSLVITHSSWVRRCGGVVSRSLGFSVYDISVRAEGVEEEYTVAFGVRDQTC